MARESLFRREALEHRQAQGLGEVRLVRPLSTTLLTWLVLAIAASVAVFLAWGDYARKARLSGLLVPEGGVIRLLPPQDAMVLERRAIEGARVRRGDLLFVLSLERDPARGDAVQRSLSGWQRNLDDASRRSDALLGERSANLAQRLGALALERQQLVDEAGLQRQRLALATQSLRQLEALHDDHFISAAQVQTRSEEVLGLRVQVQALDRQLAAHDRLAADLKAQARELPLEAAARQAGIERERLDVAQKAAESEARRRTEVRAPQDGVLATVLADAGQSVSPATALASLVPVAARLQAQLYAPSSAVGFLHDDEPVWLRYQAFPYQKFGHQRGRVLRVSRTPLQAAEQAALTGRNEVLGQPLEPMYRVTVELERQEVSTFGGTTPLVAGMQLDADVLLERRRLAEWIFEPLLGMAGRL